MNGNFVNANFVKANSVNAAPLAGIGILITRPVRQSATFAERLAVLGGEPFILPSMVISPPADAAPFDEMLRRLGEFDFAFFVSANAAEAVVVRKPQWPPSLVALAVGPTTADALISGGITDVITPTDRHDSEGVLALPTLERVSGRRVVIFRGESDSSDGRDLFRTTITARGAIVESVACYRRDKPAIDPSPMLDAWSGGRIQGVVATSIEVLDNFLGLIGERGRALLVGTPLFVPHPRIAAHAHEIGLTNVVVTEATDAGLLAGLLQHFAQQRTAST